MKRLCKRITALLLALAMSMSLLCTGVWATEVEDVTEDSSAQTVAEEVTEDSSAAADTEDISTDTPAPADTEDTSTDIPASEDTGDTSTDTPASADAESSAPAVEEEVETSQEPSEETEVPAEEVPASASIEGLEETPALSEIDEEPLNQQTVEGTTGALTWTLDSETGVLTISGKGNMPSYEEEYAPWTPYYAYITSIKIKSGVTSIGKWAFFLCTEVTSVSIPKGVTSIDEFAFFYCTNLEKVTLPSTLKTINAAAFLQCPKLLSLTVPSSVTMMDTCAYGYNYVEDETTGESSIVAQSGTKIIGTYGSTAHKYAKANEITFQTNGLATPKSLKCSNTAKGVKVSWGKVSGATSYTLYRGKTKVRTVTATSYTDTKANKNGTKYTYKVVANRKSSDTNNKTVSSSNSSNCTYYYLSGVSCTKLKQYSKRKIWVYWKKNTKGSGYDVRVSTSSKFTDSTTWYGTISGAKKTNAVTTKTFKKGKTYYVQVRSYKKVSGKYYYSKWSGSKKIKIK